MTGRTIIIEMHRFRGLGRVGGPLGMATTLGFITVTWCPFLVQTWLRLRIAEMRNALHSDSVP